MYRLLADNDTVSISVCRGGGMRCIECLLVHAVEERAMRAQTEARDVICPDAIATAAAAAAAATAAVTRSRV